MMVWKMFLLFQGCIVRFHVNLPGCIQKITLWISSPITPSLWGCDVPCSVSRRPAWMLITGYQRCERMMGEKPWRMGGDPYGLLMAHSVKVSDLFLLFFLFCFFSGEVFYQKSPEISPNMTIYDYIQSSFFEIRLFRWILDPTKTNL